jgi:hypothetical protein
MNYFKKKNLATYLLAGSILISSVVVSMNPVNAHTTDSKKIKALQVKIEELNTYYFDKVTDLQTQISNINKSGAANQGNSGGSDSAKISALTSCVNRAFDQMILSFPKPQKC